MVWARRTVADSTWFVARRVAGRKYLLTPHPAMTATFWYLLGVYAEKHGLLLHAIVMMSNHLHYVVTAPDQVISEFMADLHREMGRVVNKRFEQRGAMFEDDEPSRVEVVGERGAVDRVLYTVMNPVKAGLVERSELWPGMRWIPGMRELTAKRPENGFEADLWPDEVTMHFTAPPAWTGTEDQWHDEIARLVAEEEGALRKERIRTGRAVLGAQLVKDQDPFGSPRTKPDKSDINPMLATGGDGPLMRRLIAELKAWRRAYRDALERWKHDKSVSFPVGTYWMVVHHGANCG